MLETLYAKSKYVGGIHLLHNLLDNYLQSLGFNINFKETTKQIPTYTNQTICLNSSYMA